MQLSRTFCLQAAFFAVILQLASGSCDDLDLGVGNGAVADNNITASSVRNASTPAKNGRLHHTPGSSWCAATSDNDPYLQIDLQALHIICAVSTQGNSQEDQWVKAYTLQSSTDGKTWIDYEEDRLAKYFLGNNDRNSEVKHVLYDGVLTRYLRFLPKSHHNGICMRTEIYGVKQKPENLALGKFTRQSSTYWNPKSSGYSYKAVDGNADTDFNNGHCSQTSILNPSWWRVDLGQNFVPVSEIHIVNRLSLHEHMERRKDYQITQGNNVDVTRNPPCIGLYSFTDFIASALCFTNPLRAGRYVGILHVTVKNQVLSLCEVEIYARENLAFRKQTDQISTLNDFDSSRAVDGNSNTSLNIGATCASTSIATKPWWRVDLGREEPVSELYIVNRGDCCGDRLSIFEIRVGKMSSDGGVNNPKCGDLYSVPEGKGLSFYCRPYAYGRYVTIRSLKSNEPLTLCEVEVYSARRGTREGPEGVKGVLGFVFSYKKENGSLGLGFGHTFLPLRKGFE